MSRATPSLVLFDLDGVLVEYDRGARVRHLAEATGRRAEDVHAALFGSGLEDRFDAGDVATPAYLDALGRALGATVDRRLWTAARGAAMRMDPALPGRLHALGSRCAIGMFTNNGGLLLDVLPELLPALTAPFGDRLLCSARLGVRKPDPRVFALAAAALGHPPAATLFLDDAPANVEGARRAGLQSAHVASPAALPGLLARFGLD